MLLGVNIDHIATLRQARYKTMPDSVNAEPSPLQGALDSKLGGADSITLHVRADRRHVQEKDAFEVRKQCGLPLNLEMGNTPELLEIALQLNPDFVCLVPETREEVTTEGGLDVLSNFEALKPTIKTLQAKGIKISLFIDPIPEVVRASAELGAEMIELHTGAFANAEGNDSLQKQEIERLKKSAILGHSLGLQINAGHGINYQNLKKLFPIPHLVEFNIGHSIISRSISIGMIDAVAEMKTLMADYPH